MDSELRQKVIELSELGEIKQKRKFLEKASEETIAAIWNKYEAEKLKEVNELATKTVLEQVSSVLCWLNIVKEKYQMDLSQDLESNKLLKADIEKIVGMITPFLPFVGFATGGLTVGKYVAMGCLEEEEEPSKSTP